MIGCATAALLGRTAAPEMQAAAFIGGSTLLAVVAVAVDLYWARFIRRTERPA